MCVSIYNYVVFDSIHGDLCARSATRWHDAYVNLSQNDSGVSTCKTLLRIYCYVLSNMPELNQAEKKILFARLQHSHNCTAKKCSARFRFASTPRSRQEARADGTTRIGTGMAPDGTGTPANDRPPRTGCGNRARTVVRRQQTLPEQEAGPLTVSCL